MDKGAQGKESGRKGRDKLMDVRKKEYKKSYFVLQ